MAVMLQRTVKILIFAVAPSLLGCWILPLKDDRPKPANGNQQLLTNEDRQNSSATLEAFIPYLTRGRPFEEFVSAFGASTSEPGNATFWVQYPLKDGTTLRLAFDWTVEGGYLRSAQLLDGDGHHLHVVPVRQAALLH